ncbi:MAG: hypothetical protein AABY22_07375, partial [Nanoarchaeota archaeon]
PKDFIMNYLDVDWGQAPWGETLSYLTEKIVEDKLKLYEWQEDKSSIYFDGTKNPEKGKDLGYYHCRNGSLAAVLLSWKNSPEHKHTYWDYLRNQPKSETLRLCMWYYYMCNATNNLHKIGKELYYPILEMVKNIGLTEEQWHEYYKQFLVYHGLT